MTDKIKQAQNGITGTQAVTTLWDAGTVHADGYRSIGVKEGPDGNHYICLMIAVDPSAPGDRITGGGKLGYASEFSTNVKVKFADVAEITVGGKWIYADSSDADWERFGADIDDDKYAAVKVKRAKAGKGKTQPTGTTVL